MILLCLHVHAPGPAAAKPAIQHTEAASDESDDEDESVESADGADPGKVMFTHITPPLSLSSSLYWTLRCPYADTLLSCFVLRYENAGSIIYGHFHHLCTCISDTRVLEQGAEADETVPPSAETLSQSDNTDKTVQLSDKSGPPFSKAPRTRRALSQPAQCRTPKPLDFVSTSASQPEVFKHMVGAHLCAVPDSLFRGLPLAQAPHVYNVSGAPQQPS